MSNNADHIYWDNKERSFMSSVRSGYTKSFETRLIKVTHEVRIWDGRNASSILEDLKKVPGDLSAVTVEMDNDFILQFEDIREEKKGEQKDKLL